MVNDKLKHIFDNQKLKSSELVREPIPNTNLTNRLSYYTGLKFDVGNVNASIIAKVDTGSSYTIIGLDTDGLEACTDYIDSYAKIENEKPEDATGNLIDIKSLVVDNFQLTEDICIPKIKLFFSKELKEKAILGMDILGLYTFLYKHEVNQIKGTIWLIHDNYTDARMVQQLQQNGYVSPLNVMMVDSTKHIIAKHKGISKKNEIKAETRVVQKYKNTLCIEVNNKRIALNNLEHYHDEKGYYVIIDDIAYYLDMKNIR